MNSKYSNNNLDPPFFMTHFSSCTVVYWHPSLPVFVDDENEDDELAYVEKTESPFCISPEFEKIPFS